MKWIHVPATGEIDRRPRVTINGRPVEKPLRVHFVKGYKGDIIARHPFDGCVIVPNDRHKKLVEVGDWAVISNLKRVRHRDVYVCDVLRIERYTKAARIFGHFGTPFYRENAGGVIISWRPVDLGDWEITTSIPAKYRGYKYAVDFSDRRPPLGYIISHKQRRVYVLKVRPSI